jgi:hypothetical protein
MRFPLRYTVGVHSYAATTPDAYNITHPAYTPALDQLGISTPVYGWAVPQTTEPLTVGHDRVIVDVQLFAPPGTPITPYDWVDLPDGQYEVLGAPDDYTHSPFGSGGGLVFNMRKVTG